MKPMRIAAMHIYGHHIMMMRVSVVIWNGLEITATGDEAGALLHHN